jgi:3-hydroxybutyryl-CoA dehydrogenase
VYGVFEHADMVGLDLVKAVQDVIVPDLSTASGAAAIHNERVRSGELGVKSGKGFLEWPTGEADRVKARRDAFVLQFLKMQRSGAFDIKAEHE